VREAFLFGDSLARRPLFDRLAWRLCFRSTCFADKICLDRRELILTTETKDPYAVAVKKLTAEGYAFDAKTCFYERGVERLKLRWNGKVYARRRGPPKPQNLGVVDSH
jgi:hypothetical protein